MKSHCYYTAERLVTTDEGIGIAASVHKLKYTGNTAHYQARRAVMSLVPLRKDIL